MRNALVISSLLFLAAACKRDADNNQRARETGGTVSSEQQGTTRGMENETPSGTPSTGGTGVTGQGQQGTTGPTDSSGGSTGGGSMGGAGSPSGGAGSTGGGTASPSGGAGSTGGAGSPSGGTPSSGTPSGGSTGGEPSSGEPSGGRGNTSMIGSTAPAHLVSLQAEPLDPTEPLDPSVPSGSTGSSTGTGTDTSDTTTPPGTSTPPDTSGSMGTTGSTEPIPGDAGVTGSSDTDTGVIASPDGSPTGTSTDRDPDYSGTTSSADPATTGAATPDTGGMQQANMTCDQLIPRSVRNQYLQNMKLVPTSDPTDIATTCRIEGKGMSQGAHLQAFCNPSEQGSMQATAAQPSVSGPNAVGKTAILVNTGELQQLIAWDDDSNCQISLSVPSSVDALAIGRRMLQNLPGKQMPTPTPPPTRGEG